MAHNNFRVLQEFLRSIDFEGADIYIHINKKVKNAPIIQLTGIIKRASIYFVRPVRVRYCDYSMMHAVITLFREATKTKHDYYHIVSGSDLLIKPHKQFDDFFKQNKGAEFVGFSPSYTSYFVEQKNYLVPLCRNKYKYIAIACAKIRRLIVKLQILLGYNVIRNLDWEVKKGYDWYSITHEAALYLLVNEPKFRKFFYRSFCPTEFFPQTVLFNSHFREKIYCLNDTNIGSLRMIDWNRGQPYVFRESDFELIINSDCIFARKFMEDIDFEIVKKISEYINEVNSL